MVTHNPLHRSGQAGLPHPGLTSGDNARAAQGIRRTSAGGRQPAVDQAPHPGPEYVGVLAAPRKVVFAQSDAQKSFDKLKTLADSWEGTYEGGPMHVALRVTSLGNTLMHEMKGDGPEDPISMIHVDGDRLFMTHYCDAGNQPRGQDDSGRKDH